MEIYILINNKGKYVFYTRRTARQILHRGHSQRRVPKPTSSRKKITSSGRIKAKGKIFYSYKSPSLTGPGLWDIVGSMNEKQLKRIADILDEILRIIKKDMGIK